MLYATFFLCGALLFTVADAAKVPKEWKICKYDKNFNVCIKKAVEEVIPHLVKGVPSLGIYSIDPLHFDKLNIGKGSGPVSLDLTFLDFDLIGLGKMKIRSLTSDWKTMKVYVEMPLISIKGDYQANGKVMILPVQGTGDCLLDLENLKTNVTIHFSTKDRGNKKYYNIDKIDLPLEVDKMTMKFNNLFNGDKRLGDQMNVFLNENWDEIFKELKPAIQEAITSAFTVIGNRVFTKIPKDLITPP